MKKNTPTPNAEYQNPVFDTATEVITRKGCTFHILRYARGYVVTSVSETGTVWRFIEPYKTREQALQKIENVLKSWGM